MGGCTRRSPTITSQVPSGTCCKKFLTILHVWMSLVLRAGSDLLSLPREPLPNQALESVRDNYRGENIEERFLAPIIEFMWEHRLNVMNQEQIIAMASNLRAVPPTLITVSFACTHQKVWRVIAQARLEESIARIILVSRTTRWDVHSLHRTHEVYKVFKMIIQTRLQRLSEGLAAPYPFPSVDLEALLAALSCDDTYTDWAEWWHPLRPSATPPKAYADLFGGAGTFLWRRNFVAAWNKLAPTVWEASYVRSFI